MACGDLSLQEVGAWGVAGLVGAADGREASVDEEWVPVSPVLFEQKDGFPSGADAGSRARGLDFHEGYEAVDLGFVGSEFGEDAAEAESVFAEGGAHEVITGGGGITLVEDEVNDFEDRGEAGGELGAAGDFEGNVFVGEGAFGADDALGNSGFGGEKGTGDLVCGEATEETEGKGGAGLGGENRVAGDEDEAEEIVADSVVESGAEVGHGLFESFQLAGDLFVFALGNCVAAEEIDGATFGSCGEPRGRVIRNAGVWPLFQSSDERLLREVFG
jgi:hypothetical protein